MGLDGFIENRDEALDLIKGLGILLVYLGHTLYTCSVPCRLIFFVHMPLFFLVSGMLFDPARYRSMGALLRRTFIGLVIPYFFFVIAAYVIKFDVQFQWWRTSPLGQLYGLFVRGDSVWALWFLICLGSVRIVYYMAHRIGCERGTAGKLVLILLCLVGAECSLRYLSPYRKYVPLMLSSVPAALFFFSIGRFCRDRMRAWLSSDGRSIVPVAVFVIACVCMFAFEWLCPIRKFDLRTGVFSVAGLPPSLLGLTAIGALVVLLRSWAPGFIRRWLLFCGTYSLIFFSMEQNASHVYSAVLRCCGIDAPEVYYWVSGMTIVKIGRIIFCFAIVAVLVPAIDRLLYDLTKFLNGGENES